MELFDFIRTASLSGKLYAFVIVDEEGTIVRNKAMLVAQGYNQEEGIDYGETYAPVARLEAIRMLLAFACFKDFKLFQMDVKSDFFFF
jgi:hypothetical protein